MTAGVAEMVISFVPHGEGWGFEFQLKKQVFALSDVKSSIKLFVTFLYL